jgi:hypothetical protein
MISVEVEMDQIIMAGMVFRAVNVRMAGISPFHGLRAVTGGVLWSSVKVVLGAAVCPTSLTPLVEVTALRVTVFLSVASGINFCDKRGQSQALLSYVERSKKDGVIY